MRSRVIVALLPIIIRPPIISFAIGTVPIITKSKIQLKIICNINTGVTRPALSIWRDFVWKTYAKMPDTDKANSINTSNQP